MPAFLHRSPDGVAGRLACAESASKLWKRRDKKETFGKPPCFLCNEKIPWRKLNQQALDVVTLLQTFLGREPCIVVMHFLAELRKISNIYCEQLGASERDGRKCLGSWLQTSPVFNERKLLGSFQDTTISCYFPLG